MGPKQIYTKMFAVHPRLDETNMSKPRGPKAPQSQPEVFDPDEDHARESFMATSKPTKEQLAAQTAQSPDNKQAVVWLAVVLLVVGLIGLIIWMVIQNNKGADDQLRQYFPSGQNEMPGVPPEYLAQQEFAAQQQAAAQQMAFYQAQQQAAQQQHAQQYAQRRTMDQKQAPLQPQSQFQQNQNHATQQSRPPRNTQNDFTAPNDGDEQAVQQALDRGKQTAPYVPQQQAPSIAPQQTGPTDVPQKSSIEDVLRETADVVVGASTLDRVLGGHRAEQDRERQYQLLNPSE